MRARWQAVSGRRCLALLEVRNVSKTFGGTRALSGGLARRRPGRDRRAPRRERRRQVDAHQDPGRGLLARRGHDQLRRPGRLARAAQDAGRLHPPGPRPHRVDDGRREHLPDARLSPRRRRLIDWNAARSRAAQALALLDADIHPDVRINALSRTDKSLVAIARALAAEAEILVLDEPTASLPADEVARLFKALRRLRDRNVGMIYVSHRLDEVFEIGDRVVVLRDGRVAGERRIGETTPEEVILLIVGREPSQVFRRPPQRQGRAAADPRAPDRRRRSGRSTARSTPARSSGSSACAAPGRSMSGARSSGSSPMTGGRATLEGAPLAPRSPRRGDARRREPRRRRPGGGIGDAHALGAREHVREPAGGRTSASSPTSRRPARAPPRGRWARRWGSGPTTRSWRSSSSRAATSRRWCSGAGCTCGAGSTSSRTRRPAWTWAPRPRSTGSSTWRCRPEPRIIIVSTDFEEIAKVCHRALVFDRGRVVAELAASDLSIENLLAAASARVGHAASETSEGPHAVH